MKDGEKPTPFKSKSNHHELPSYKTYSMYGADISLDWGYNVIEAIQFTEVQF